MKRLAILMLLLLATAQAQTSNEAAVLSARVDVSLDASLARATTTGAPLRTPTEATEAGCHHDGEFRIEVADGDFRFQEEREQAGCGELRLPLLLPEPVSELRISFTATRQITQTAQQGTLQLPIDNTQVFRLYDGDILVFDQNLYTPSQAPDATGKQFDIVVNTAAMSANLTAAWYFEDTGDRSIELLGGASGRAFQARVRDIQFDVPDVQVPLASVATTAAVERGEVIEETVEATIDIPSGWDSANLTLLVQHLVSLELVRVIGPDGEARLADDIQQQQVGGQVQLAIPVQQPGGHRLQFLGTTPVPEVPPAPITRLAWLLPAAIAIAGLVHVGATYHQFILRRDAAPYQRATIVRKDIELALMTVALAILIGLGLSRYWDDTTTLPISRTGILIYALFGVLATAAAFHLGIGIVRRRHARDLARSKEIEQANAVLARSNRDLEQFAYVASHDLQEPLRKVASFTSLLERRYKDKLDAKGQGYVDNAHDAALRARTLIRDLLAFSRIGQDAPMTAVDLNRTLDEVRAELADELRKHKASLDVQPLPTVTGSAPLLLQLLLNLVGNAIKYRDPSREPAIEVGARPVRGHWQLYVRDNGLGIAAEHQDQVFQIFQRLHGRGSGHEGSGIGLAICQRIAEFHGGRIGLKSKPGVGSEFYVELPMDEG